MRLPNDDTRWDANVAERRHWVRCTTACNNRCRFCLDSATPRSAFVLVDEVERQIDWGIEQLGATRLVLSGGEATLHPKFVDFVRYGNQAGYERVQCITNGSLFADRAFFEACAAAGLGEVTFSLHGHTAELHDYLTRRKGSFEQLLRGMTRAVRDGRMIVNVDICLNKQNIAHIEAIIELCLALGVNEFDLLQVIPHGEAFDNREELFYDAVANDGLRRVLRLSRHPRITIWTNRLPVATLEGFEELIQAPDKLEGEVNGRRYHIRRYLDFGTPLECRQQERCIHCFVEPFCTTMDRVVELTRTEAWDIWWLGDEPLSEATVPSPLPFGCERLGLTVDSLAALPDEAKLHDLFVYERRPTAERLERRLELIADTPDHLAVYLGRGDVPSNVQVEVRLNKRTAAWLLDHREALEASLSAVRLHQPAVASREQAARDAIDAPAELFAALGLRLRVSGLPPCLAPGTVLTLPPLRLERSLFEPQTGRFDMQALARFHAADWYNVKSSRCDTCRVGSRCEGCHVSLARRHGLSVLDPGALADAWGDDAEQQLLERWPDVPTRLATGRRPEPPCRSLPGFAAPVDVPLDPFSLLLGDPPRIPRSR